MIEYCMNTEYFNSFDTGTSQTSLQAKDDRRPERPNIAAKIPPLSLTVIDFSPTERAFFVRVARPDGLGEKEGFIRIRTVPAVLWFLRMVGEFPSSLKEELGRSRILRFLYSNGLRNQRLKNLIRIELFILSYTEILSIITNI
ncbi:hypothetical protein AVEN_26110-1 [Araneus ventricosus]|uniref:Uncharacterized protein n=1 Tax=Araneus ventricosus TaxID=182803 RepID=A0A4Y2Q8F9_ARAVE|nr:hypothetical protein AVEN_26110-1 [Araneus ventricosus]